MERKSLQYVHSVYMVQAVLRRLCSYYEHFNSIFGNYVHTVNMVVSIIYAKNFRTNIIYCEVE
jgi:hypothetical protein